MDFDIAGLLANPDFQYMLAKVGEVGGAAYGNPLAQAIGGVTSQGIGTKNQMAVISRLLGLGGGAKVEGTTAELGGWDRLKQIMGAHPDNKMTFDGDKMNITGNADSLNKAFGSGTTPQAPMQTSALNTPSSGGQPGIINPSVGLPGDLSGLSLAGLKPEDINKALALGLTGADLERKRVSDLLVNEYHRELIEERRATRGAKEATVPIEVPGLGQLTLPQFNALPSKTKAYAYAMQLRKQNGQGMISPEQFERETDPASMERLVERAMTDPGFKDMWFKSKAAGATQINLGDKAALQRQTEGIKNFSTLKDPKFKGFEISEDEQYTLAVKNKTWIGAPKFVPILTKAKIDKILALIKGTGATIHEKDVKVEGNEIVIPVTTTEGVKDVIRRPVK